MLSLMMAAAMMGGAAQQSTFMFSGRNRYQEPQPLTSNSFRGNAIPNGVGGNGRKRAKLARQTPHSKYAK